MLQVVTAANIIGAGNGLEVGRRLELLSVRGAEAEAEQAVRLSTAAASQPPQVTQNRSPGPQVRKSRTFAVLGPKPLA